MGRAPCCEKVGLKRGRWTAEEDEILKNYIQTHGEGSWRSLPKNAGLLRCGKSCRLRWINYLRTDVKRGNITPQEEDIIVKLHATMGNRWSLIAGHLSGRTDNEIKNYWNSHLSRKIHYFRKPSINTCANNQNQITLDFDASKTIATAPVLPPPRRQGGGRVSRAAMKKNKNKQLYHKDMHMGKDNNKGINNNATDTPTATALMCDDQVQVGPNSEVDLVVEDHCTNGILADQAVINGGIQAESCSTATSSQFGECGTTLDWEWGLYNHDQFMVDDRIHAYDHLWMSIEEEGSTGSEEDQIISWLWDTTDDVSGIKEASQTSNELDSEERQEAMVAWLMS